MFCARLDTMPYHRPGDDVPVGAEPVCGDGMHVLLSFRARLVVDFSETLLLANFRGVGHHTKDKRLAQPQTTILNTIYLMSLYEPGADVPIGAEPVCGDGVRLPPLHLALRIPVRSGPSPASIELRSPYNTVVDLLELLAELENPAQLEQED